MDDFEKELKIGFLQEAQQLLTDAEQCFLSLESDSSDPAILEQIFRIAHNLKGSSKAVGFDEMGRFTHEFESLLLKIKNGQVPKHTQSLNLLLRCNDHLRQMVEELTNNLEAKIDSEALIAEIIRGQNGEFEGAPASESAPAETPASTPEESSFEQVAMEETLADAASHNGSDQAPDAFAADEGEISLSAIDALLAAETAKAIESAPAAPAPVLQAVPPPAQAPADASASASNSSKNASPTVAVKDESIRVSLGRLDKLLDFVGEMVILQSVLREQAAQSEVEKFRKIVHQLGKVTKEVQDISMGLRMIPVKQTFQKMQRIVRDTAQLLGKKVQLHLAGEETELDKTVLESLGDPLVHLIRNAVDHGVESAEKRKERGKPETGNVHLSAYHQGGRLVIEIRDDGGGIDGNVLKQKAVEKGLIKANSPLTAQEAVHLIFHPGFSTKAQVTEVSGRGVGMDVVKTNIEKIQGEIQIDTEIGVGTTFRVFLPLTLAIIDGMVVQSADDRFVIPLAQVHETVRPGEGDIQKTTGIGEVLILRGETLPLFRLRSLLNQKTKESQDGIAIVVRTGKKPFAVFIDDIIGQSQIVIKKLGAELMHLKGFSGSAILGDGKPSLILELPELVSRTPRPSAPPVKAA